MRYSYPYIKKDNITKMDGKVCRIKFNIFGLELTLAKKSAKWVLKNTDGTT
jgi:hypothetical protein